MPCGRVNDLVNAGKREGVLRVGLVKVFEIDTKALGFVLLWYHDHVCQLVRVFDLTDEPSFQ